MEEILDCEELCCVCDITLKNSDEYSNHLETDAHLTMLVENRFLSEKIANLVKHLMKLYGDSDCGCSVKMTDFESYANHLKCPAKYKGISDVNDVSTMTDDISSNDTSSNGSLPCNQSSLEQSTEIACENRHSKNYELAHSKKVPTNGVKDLSKLRRTKHYQKHLMKQYYNNKANKVNGSVSYSDHIFELDSGLKPRKIVETAESVELDKNETSDVMIVDDANDESDLPDSIGKTSEFSDCIDSGHFSCQQVEDVNLGHETDSVASHLPIIRGKNVSHCAFNRPIVNCSKKEYSYAFFIYQCSSCKALLDFVNIEAHFSSEFHQSFVVQVRSPDKETKEFVVNCLPCNVRIKGAAQLVRHRESEEHCSILMNLAENRRKIILDILGQLKQDEKMNYDLQPQLDSLRSFGHAFGAKFNNLFYLYKLLAMFHRDSNSRVDVFPDRKIKLIPELNFYLNQGNKNLVPQTFKTFKGLFMCTSCGLLFGNLFSLTHHILGDMNHIIKCCFKSPLISCLLCEKMHNVVSLSVLLQVHRKIDLTSGAKSQCVWPESISSEIDVSQISKQLESKSSIDLKQSVGSYRCNLCSNEKTNDSIFEAYQHVCSEHSSSVFSGAITSMKCLCCYQNFSSFSFLLRHAFENDQEQEVLKV